MSESTTIVGNIKQIPPEIIATTILIALTSERSLTFVENSEVSETYGTLNMVYTVL